MFRFLFLIFFASELSAAPAPTSRSRGRVPIANNSAAPAARASVAVVASEPEPEPEPAVEVVGEEVAVVAESSGPEPEEIENKSEEFSAMFGVSSASFGEETPLQRSIREQKEKLGLSAAALDSSGAASARTASIGRDTAVACDEDLRQCMASKCGGADFSKCYNDSDTDWGMKMDSCRRDAKCTGEEFAALSVEINADRKQNFELSRFGEIVRCGKTYNDCLRDRCGNDGYTKCIARGNPPAQCGANFATSYEKCWSKSGGDGALAACEGEYEKCRTADSGLQSRAMEMFAGLRVELEKNILQWDLDLREMRDSMEGMCKLQNGMLDQRSLTCVYTVELFADNDGEDTRFASRKIKSGDTYACNPDEFGIDITAFKENAYRLTRSQTAASSAMLGSGAGVAVGAVASGAVGRAIESSKAAGALNRAQESAAQAQAGESGGEGSDVGSGDVGSGDGGDAGGDAQ